MLQLFYLTEAQTRTKCLLVLNLCDFVLVFVQIKSFASGAAVNKWELSTHFTSQPSLTRVSHHQRLRGQQDYGGKIKRLPTVGTRRAAPFPSYASILLLQFRLGEFLKTQRC